ncbi:acriflavin resistance protein [Alkalilimnicola ehrlichii]|uniref:Acriflavin resistance protein n=1 Tax=Alkalilimnicola ehrlichii TaxID=351052 RepID=A0A3E0WN05_9GAMM|nr:efflux RND transporter permease subunit [Alkalilimnicola ehrlichii]RFA27771.1 acriflavin resistance protein [Alkalilimnicola ehrlichii]RFA33583.1 acriflavin resistance protein [Alkalilimnicola ehrlichii]
MKLTAAALNSSRLTFFAALLILVTGAFTFLSFPAQEEPTVTIRDAMVYVSNPGMPAERMEQLVAKPLEERLRQLSELKNVVSTVRTGSVIMKVSLRDEVQEMLPAWQRVRTKVEEVVPLFPEGTLPPQVDDDFGSVAIASIAVTAPEFSMSEMRAPLRQLREGLYRVPGVQKVSFHGLQGERIYIEFDRARMAGLGLSAAHIQQQLQERNILQPGGRVVVSGLNSAIAASGELRSVQDLREFTLSVPATGDRDDAAPARVRLGDVAQIRVLTPDPPESAAIYRGEDAVVLGVSMHPGENIQAVGKALREHVTELEQLLPAGFSLDYVTFQADAVKHEIDNMSVTMLQTILIVMIVVVLFIGWRAGIVAGSIVPLTICATLLVMRMLGIELHIVSMAAIIIALGLLVDSSIVIVEDIERRLTAGEDRLHACIEACRSLAIPLLTSLLVIILAFSPFFFGYTVTNEYMRPLVVVLTVALIGSWILCLTVIPLLCHRFLPTRHGDTDGAPRRSAFYETYARLMHFVLDHKKWYLAAMTLLLSGSLVILANQPAGFLPPSDRPQFQIELELQPGSDSRLTQHVVRDLSRWLSDPEVNPEVTTSIGYVAEGGPRVVLVITPPLPATHVGYFTVSVARPKDVETVMARTRKWMAQHYPEVRADIKRFSRGENDAGTVVYRVSGPEEAVLRDIGDQIKETLRSLPAMGHVRDNWGPRVPRIDVQVNQEKARAQGISNEDISTALAKRYSGLDVSVLRDGDTLVPLIIRGSDGERGRPEDLANTLLYPLDGGAAVPLSAVATVALDSEPSAIHRRNLERTLSVEGRSSQETAHQVVNRAASAIDRIKIPPGYRIELGGEIEEAAESNEPLVQYLPHALVAIVVLFLWQFGSFRKLVVIFASIPFALVGVGPALALAGEPFGFMATFGVLSLAGIITSNAVLLLERIDVELGAEKAQREAVVSAAVARLRPIVMTQLTCIVGLVPLLLFGGTLWAGMAVTIMGGLLLGTLITLGLVPVLYEMLFNAKLSRWSRKVFGAKVP